MTDDHPFIARARAHEAVRDLVAVAIAGIVCAIGACRSPPPVTPPFDAGDAGPDVCALACQNLAALGCSEATPNCSTVCRHNRDAGLVPLDAKCASTAANKDAARACAGIVCR